MAPEQTAERGNNQRVERLHEQGADITICSICLSDVIHKRTDEANFRIDNSWQKGQARIDYEHYSEDGSCPSHRADYGKYLRLYARVVDSLSNEVRD